MNDFFNIYKLTFRNIINPEFNNLIKQLHNIKN